jgi:hypothetical protein
VVTGGRDTIAVLTIHPTDKNGNTRWELDNGATLWYFCEIGKQSSEVQTI